MPDQKDLKITMPDGSVYGGKPGVYHESITLVRDDGSTYEYGGKASNAETPDPYHETITLVRDDGSTYEYGGKPSQENQP